MTIMCRKLLYFVPFIFILALATTSQADLEGYWPLDGDANDLSGNGRNGTITGRTDPNWPLDPNIFVEGAVGQAIFFGGNGYVNIDGYKGITAINGVQQEFSVANWLKITETSGDHEMVTWGTAAAGTRSTWRVHQGRLRAEHGNGNLRGNTYVNDGEWHHAALTVVEGANLQVPNTILYVDGVQDTTFAGSNNTYNLGEGADVSIGRRADNGTRYWPGSLDEVYIFSRVLDANQVPQVMNGIMPSWPKADKQSPAEGALIEEASTFLGWRAGMGTTTHNIYFGTTSDLGPDQLVSQQAENTYLASGIVPDQTYYWRIDEVDAEGTVTTGDVWSFFTAPKSAYNPSPSDGEKILDTTATLSWSGGWAPIMHAVYFGTDHDTVANAAGAPLQMDIGFDPGPLENDKTYYWRVDEFYGAEWVTGAVWSFSVVPILPPTDDPNLVALWTFDGDTGGVALDQSGNGNHVALRNGAQIVAGRGGDVLDMGEAGYGAISNMHFDANSTGLTEVAVLSWIRTDIATDQYIISLDRSDYYRLEINGSGGGDGQVGWDLMTDAGQLDHGSVTRVDDGEWHHVAGIFNNGTASIYIDGFAEPSKTLGTSYGIGSIRYGLIGANSEEGTFDDGTTSGGPPIPLIDDMAIYDKAFTEDEMRQTYGNLSLAWQPQPAIGAVGDIWAMSSLAWTPGDGAVEHDVYISTDPNAVADANASDTTGVYQGRVAEASYVATDGIVFDSAHYWRVDEVGADGTISKGRIWTFTTTAEIVIYDVETILDYDNSVDPFLSQLSLAIDPAQDLTGGCGGGIGAIAISYSGQSGPGSVTVDDVNGTVTVVGRGADIIGTADEFQYAYTTLVMNGSMTVKVDSLAHTDNWTKAGIMIRESLDSGSAFAGLFVTGANGVQYQARAMTSMDATNDSSVATAEQQALTAPVWLKIERMFPMVNAYYSTDGVTWIPMSWNPQVIPMSPAPIHIGLAVTSHSGASTFAEAVFSNISSVGGVMPGPLKSTEIGLASNSAEPMYMVLEDASGATSAVVNPDPAATQQTAVTDWIIDLDEFSIDRTAVTSATLVIGNLDNPAAGGSGSITISNVRLLGDCEPIAHWALDDGAGTIASDSSYGGKNAGVVNGDPNWVAGTIGGALELNGDDYVDCGNPDILNIGTGDWTVSAWIQTTQTEKGTVFANGGDDSDGIRYALAMNESNDEKMTLTLDDNVDKVQVKGATVVIDGSWHHVVAMRAGATASVYVDGILDGTETLPEGYDLSGASQQNALIGAIWSQSDGVIKKFFAGLIDDVRVYDRALSEAEIAGL